MALGRADYNILPADARAGGLLPWIIAVMMYLCALAIFSAVSLQFGIATWSENLERSFTIQVPAETAGQADFDVLIHTALSQIEGVASIDVLSRQENKDLLETWLGKGNVSDELPVPALIDVTLAVDAQVPQSTLDAALSAFPGARVERSASWLSQIKTAALSIIANAYFVVMLVLAATLAVVTFGTRAQLAAHQSTILIVHHMGAEDRVIAREFQYSFLKLGLIGGLLGTAMALLTIVILWLTFKVPDVGLVAVLIENWFAVLFIVPIPLGAALLTMLTARFTVFSSLKAVL
ncbi:MAG: hypothetical protein AAF607_04270 [Pseudomonadota bacterium]